MEHMRGILKVRVRRGVNLAVRDACSSDPYVVITMGTQACPFLLKLWLQKVKTNVKKSNCNPEWNEELSLSVTNANLPLKLTVYDEDKFSKHDKMGDAEIDLKPYFQCIQLGLGTLPIGTSVKKIQPGPDNCLADESKVTWIGNGKMIQDMILKLQHVESGKLQIQIEWIDLKNVPGVSTIFKKEKSTRLNLAD
ncbi:hypothetical protein V2J09_015094 [Rumex salicifolius]